MAEMFLEVNEAPGESQDFQYHDKIEIQAWNWAIKNLVKWDTNQGGQSTRTDIEKVTVQKTCDKASVVLSTYCTNGKHFPKMIIHCRKNNGDEKVEYLKFEMNDVMISRLEWHGEGSEQSLKEEVHLEFAEYHMTYTLQGDVGTAQGKTEAGYNIQKQKAA